MKIKVQILSYLFIYNYSYYLNAKYAALVN